MDKEKYIMLKTVVPTKEEITLGLIKGLLYVGDEEAVEMLDNLAREGLIEPLAYDGTHFKVKKF